MPYARTHTHTRARFHCEHIAYAAHASMRPFVRCIIETLDRKLPRNILFRKWKYIMGFECRTSSTTSSSSRQTTTTNGKISKLIFFLFLCSRIQRWKIIVVAMIIPRYKISAFYIFICVLGSVERNNPYTIVQSPDRQTMDGIVDTMSKPLRCIS